MAEETKGTEKAPIEEITNKLTEAAEEGIEVDVTIKQHKERKPREKKKYWWTQRDKNSNCFEIRKTEFPKKFCLLINETCNIIQRVQK